MTRVEQRVRIMFVVSSPGGGGAERAAANICRHLASGHDVAVLPLMSRGGYDYGAPVLRDTDPYHESTSVVGKPGRLLRKLRHVRAAAREFGPDIVVSFGDGANLVATIGRRLFQSKIVISQQVKPLSMYTRFERPIYYALLRIFYPRADVVIASSQGVAVALEALCPRLPAPLVVWNSVDLSAIRSTGTATAHTEGPDRRLALISVGRLEPQKDHDTLLHALTRLPITARPRLQIVGDGSLRHHLQALAGELGLLDDVEFVGWRDDVFALIRAADMLVLHSRFEGFGNVIIEALALGKPVIATDCDFGPAEILGHGAYGLLVPTEDPAALARGIWELVARPELRADLAAAALCRAEAFDIAVIGDQWLAALKPLTAAVAPSTKRNWKRW